ncbi:MAG TPA: hypothetical protein VGM64_15370 [Lacunisphaera sp.]|jgi:hypothetical protein
MPEKSISIARRIIAHASLMKCHALLLLVLVLGACTKVAPLDEKVVATSDSDFEMWKSDVAGDFNLQEWQDFDGALQDIKFEIMASGKASGTTGVSNAAYTRINGKTVREVLKTGFDLKLKRLGDEREKVAAFLVINKNFKTRAGDEESASQLANIREEQARRLEELDSHIAEAREVVQRRGL